MSKIKKKKKGFTIVELLVIIVVITVIALIAVPVILNVVEESRVGSFKDSVYGALESAELYDYRLIEGEDTFSEEGVEIGDLDLKSQFIRGKIYKDGDYYRAFNLTDGRYCGNGLLLNVVVTKGDCGSIDETPPNKPLITYNILNSNTLEVYMEATDNETYISKYEIKLNDDNFITMENISNGNRGIIGYHKFEGLTAGDTYRLNGKAYDAGSNSSDADEETVTMSDFNAPRITASNTNWTKDPIDVTITWEERIDYKKSLEYKYIWQENNATKETNVLTEDEYTKDMQITTEKNVVIASSSDGITTRQTQENFDYFDKTAPTCGTITGSSTTWTNANRTVNVACVDDNCLQPTFSKTFSSGTMKTSNIVISDKAGNVATCPVNVYVDKEPPSTPTAGSLTINKATTSGSVDPNNGSGGVTYRYIISSTATTPANTDTRFTATATYTSNCSGTKYYAWAIALDAVGNKSGVKSLGTYTSVKLPAVNASCATVNQKMTCGGVTRTCQTTSYKNFRWVMTQGSIPARIYEGNYYNVGATVTCSASNRGYVERRGGIDNGGGPYASVRISQLSGATIWLDWIETSWNVYPVHAATCTADPVNQWK